MASGRRTTKEKEENKREAWKEKRETEKEKRGKLLKMSRVFFFFLSIGKIKVKYVSWLVEIIYM